MSRQAGWLAQIGLYNDCYALCLPLCLLGLGGPRWSLLSVGGVPLCRGWFCRSRLCVLGSSDWGNVYWGHSFFLFGTGDISDCWSLCCWCHGSRRSLFLFLFPLFCVAVRGFPCFPWVSCPFLFGFVSLDFLRPLGPGGVGGSTAGGGLSRVGFGSRCCGGSPLFPFLSFVTVGHWVIGRPRNGSRGGLLELLLCRFLGFLVLAPLTVHSAQRQQGRGLRVLGTNCSLYESEFRLCPKCKWALQLLAVHTRLT